MVGIDEAITRLNEAIACECDGERSRQFIDDLKLVVAEAEAGRWRPIETAPKDGTLLDGWAVTDARKVAQREPDIMWDDEAGKWIDPDYEDVETEHYRLTHWRPLPPAPEA